MKRIVLMLIPALIYGVFFTNCSSDDSKRVDVKTTEGLYVFGDAAGVTKSGMVRADEKTGNMVFTGDDIVSFTVWRNEGQIGGQICFTEAKMNEIISRVELYSELHFLIDDKLVFDPPIRIYRGLALSFSDADFDLQFRYDGFNVFLTDVYMTLDSISSGERETMMEELTANKQKRQQEFDVFIAYLKDAGKLVNEIVVDIPGIDPLPEKSDTLCSLLFDKNVDKVTSFVEVFLSGLSNDGNIHQKIDRLMAHFKAYPCINDVEISEIEASSSSYNVMISFSENGETENINFVISLSEKEPNDDEELWCDCKEELYRYVSENKKEFIYDYFLNNRLVVYFERQVQENKMVDFINQLDLFEPVSVSQIVYSRDSYLGYEDFYHFLSVYTKAPKTCTQLKEIIRMLENSPLVACAGLTFEMGNHLTMVGYIFKVYSLGYIFYVKVKDKDDLSDLYAVAEETNTLILWQNESSPLWFTLKANKNSKYSNAVQMANFFFETGKFAAVDSDFGVIEESSNPPN